MMGNWKRTHTCGELDEQSINKEVLIMGWVNRRRDHGGLIFLDLRDRDGMTQVLLDPNVSEDAHKLAENIRNEFVVAIKGKVRKRPQGTENAKLKTGFVEVVALELKILNDSLSLPFLMDDYIDIGEDIRLKYRYLDLRRPKIQRNLFLRNNLIFRIRQFLFSKGFVDVETPSLAKSTPEGARDYLVPSRVNPGKFYALPQSPQIFKQLLMIAGFDKYYQIVKCFRDEDLRADRQPEFTQLDMEMSFIDRDDLLTLLEAMVQDVFENIANIKVDLPIKRISYAEAMDKYGTDAPDIRFKMHLKEINDIVKDSSYNIFSSVIKEGGIVKGLNAENSQNFSRKDIDSVIDFAISLGAKGLNYIRINNDGYSSPLTKYLGEEKLKEIVSLFNGKTNDTIFIAAGAKNVVNLVLSKVRLMLAKKLNIIPDNVYEFAWVLDFPLFEWNADEKRYDAVHHPFTSPMDEDLKYFETDPLKIRAKAYDLVLNGQEIGGGSIRIHRSDIQSKMFKTLGLTNEQIEKKFGFFVDALKYGTPPHGGIAFGIDRIVSILCKADSIRDVIAFPKNQRAICLMTDAPSEVDEKQLKELNILLDL
jgi:aspartyl-tRNA synthetase